MQQLYSMYTVLKCCKRDHSAHCTELRQVSWFNGNYCAVQPPVYHHTLIEKCQLQLSKVKHIAALYFHLIYVCGITSTECIHGFPLAVIL